jgi:L,D-peptidoglycan transpeptidase YkuD (ErfK/YbiS/YcfS/YnhG family)
MRKIVTFLILLLPAGEAFCELVPAWLVLLPESTPTVFVAETSASAFHRFDRVATGIRRVGRDYMSIGVGGIDKRRAGDQRTPLGIYFVTEQLDTTRMHEKYGAMAFPLDYPNAWDRRSGRSGNGIWVHGVDPNGGTRPPLDTDGCIALPNDRLSVLEPAFAANVTPVLIAATMSWAEQDAITEIRVALKTAVARWAAALRDGDMYAWLDSYDEEFRHWGMSKDEWALFSVEIVAQRPISAVKVSDLLLLGDPAEEGLYLSRFRLEVREGDTRTVVSTRRLYWRRSESGAFRIVAEDSG